MGGQFSATSQFYLHGRSHFTRTGYEAHRKAYPNYKKKPDILETVSLIERIYMVTGANSGIGREITTYLVSKGATVYMVCRNEAKATDSKKSISQQAGPGSEERLVTLICDCSLEGDVRKMWAQFTEERRAIENPKSGIFTPRLDGLICNAGALLNTRTLTAEGVEVTFAAHLLFGTYLLGTLAIPSLIASNGRLLIVSSGGMLNTKFPAWEVATSTGEAKAKYDGQMAYAYAKRGQVAIEMPLSTRRCVVNRWTNKTDAKRSANRKACALHPNSARSPARSRGTCLALRACHAALARSRRPSSPAPRRSAHYYSRSCTRDHSASLRLPVTRATPLTRKEGFATPCAPPPSLPRHSAQRPREIGGIGTGLGCGLG